MARKTGLIIVDMLEQFTKPKWTPLWIPDATKQIPKIKDLADCCRERGVPIIYTYSAFRSDQVDVAPPWFLAWAPMDKFDDYNGPRLLQKESIDLALKPEYGKDILIAKSWYSAFSGTILDFVLKNLVLPPQIV